MATAKPHASPRQGPSRHRLRNTLVGLAALAAAATALLWHRVQAEALLGASYGARVACSCRYVERRSLSDCLSDFEPGMALVMLHDDRAARQITARVPLIVSQTASFREGAGCLLQSWNV